MVKLSFNGKRVGAGILLLVALFCVANYYFEWRIFGRFNKEVMVGVFIIMFIYQLRIGPTLEEIQNYRDNRRREKHASAGFRSWVYLLTLSVVMLIFVLIGPGLQLAKGKPVQREDWIELIVIEALVVLAGVIGWYQAKRRLSRNRQA